MSLLQRIDELNSFDPAGFLPFMLEGECIGLVRQGFVDKLAVHDDAFTITAHAITFQQQLNTVESRTARFSSLIHELIDDGVLDYHLNEPYPVKGRRDQVFFVADRALVPYLGFRSYGQHINGFVQKPDGMYLWIARRALDRRIFPGKLDNMVAGGLPYGLSLQQNLLKECHEEAGMPEALAAKARAVSAITYNAISEKGYKPDTLYCYDIELTEEFQPVNTDGEVDSFELMPVEAVINKVTEGGWFKPNCNLVLIDFFARHGLLDPQHEDFLKIQQGLHVSFWYDQFEKTDKQT